MNSARKGFVLVFHSQNVAGYDHATLDDHVALDESLSLVVALRLPVLRLVDTVRYLQEAPDKLPMRYVCLTFDDGTDFDWKEVTGPAGQVHEPFAAILKRHGAVNATSFVIASPQAREDIMRPLKPVRMSEDWWDEAQESGLIDIGLHGWDHVHPSVTAMQSTPDLIERFDRVASPEQAQLQIDKAADYIAARAGPASARVFAYPYGQVSDFLADSYLPAQSRILAAFTTAGVALEDGMDRWRLPRFVCGWHWRSSDELRALLQG